MDGGRRPQIRDADFTVIRGPDVAPISDDVAHIILHGPKAAKPQLHAGWMPINRPWWYWVLFWPLFLAIMIPFGLLVRTVVNWLFAAVGW